MVKTLLTTLAVLGLSFPGTKGVEKTYQVDTEASTVTWVGKKVTGKHTGTISIQEGSLNISTEHFSTGSIVMDMTSIHNTDMSGEMAAKLEGHLKSDDFFGVSNFPTSKLVIKRIVPQGGTDFKVVGEITIKQTTKEIKFPATIEMDDNQFKATAKITIDRTDFDVRYGSGSFFDGLGDKTIKDNFDLEVSLVAK